MFNEDFYDRELLCCIAHSCDKIWMNHNIKLEWRYHFPPMDDDVRYGLQMGELSICFFLVVAFWCCIPFKSSSAQYKRTQCWNILSHSDFEAVHSGACCTDAGVRSSATGTEAEGFLPWGQNKRVVCYVSVSLVLLPAMHNECHRHALSMEFASKLARVSLTWPGPHSVCVKASVSLLCLHLGPKPQRPKYSILQHVVKRTIHRSTKAYCIKVLDINKVTNP